MAIMIFAQRKEISFIDTASAYSEVRNASLPNVSLEGTKPMGGKKRGDKDFLRFTFKYKVLLVTLYLKVNR
jgi:hypothetical protein